MALFNYILVYLLIIPLSAKRPEEIANQLENELSKIPKSSTQFLMQLKENNIILMVSSIKHMLTYSSRDYSWNDIVYNQPVFYYLFHLKITIKEKNSVIVINRQMIMRHDIDSLYIKKNDLGVYSPIFSPSDKHAYFEGDVDLNDFKFYKVINKQLPVKDLTAFLFNSMSDEIKRVLRENFLSNYEFYFQKFIKMLANTYHTVVTDRVVNWPKMVCFKKIKYRSVLHETRYSTKFQKVSLTADFHLNGAEYSAKVEINFISFGIYGLSFDKIFVFEQNYFLKEIIPQIFNRVFKQFDFKEVVDK